MDLSPFSRDLFFLLQKSCRNQTAISIERGTNNEARDKNSQQVAIKRIKPRQLIAAVGNNRPRAATSGGQLFLRRG